MNNGESCSKDNSEKKKRNKDNRCNFDSSSKGIVHVYCFLIRGNFFLYVRNFQFIQQALATVYFLSKHILNNNFPPTLRGANV